MTFFRLLILFTLIPLAELKLLFWVANQIGGLQTIALVLVTGVVGAHLARHQGKLVIRAIQNDLQSCKMPTDHLLSGLLVLVGGVFLVTPGVVTDFLGLMLMIPGNRRLLMAPLKGYLTRHFKLHTTPSPFSDMPFGGAEKDVDAREVPDDKPPLDG